MILFPHGFIDAQGFGTPDNAHPRQLAHAEFIMQLCQRIFRDHHIGAELFIDSLQAGSQVAGVAQESVIKALP